MALPVPSHTAQQATQPEGGSLYAPSMDSKPVNMAQALSLPSAPQGSDQEKGFLPLCRSPGDFRLRQACFSHLWTQMAGQEEGMWRQRGGDNLHSPAYTLWLS